MPVGNRWAPPGFWYEALPRLNPVTPLAHQRTIRRPWEGSTEMHALLEFLLRHGYVLLLGWVFAEQAGLPLAFVPLLPAAGVFAWAGPLKFLHLPLACTRAARRADTM